MRELTTEELETVARQFPTHLGEPAVAVLIQRMVTEVRERRAADRPAASWRDAYSKAHLAVGELLKLARSSRRDTAAIDAAEHRARAVLAALQREAENSDTARHREQDNAIRSDALSRTIAAERNAAYIELESLRASVLTAEEVGAIRELISYTNTDLPASTRIAYQGLVKLIAAKAET